MEEADWRESNSAKKYDTVIRRETNKQTKKEYLQYMQQIENKSVEW